jgi:hypothetical protein
VATNADHNEGVVGEAISAVHAGIARFMFSAVKGHVFESQRSGIDPVLPFKIDTVNERKARESGPWARRGLHKLRSWPFPIRCILLSRMMDAVALAQPDTDLEVESTLSITYILR